MSWARRWSIRSGAFQPVGDHPRGWAPGRHVMALGARSNALATAPITIDAGAAPAPATAPTPPEPAPAASPTPPAPAPDALAPNPTAAFAPAADPAVAGVTYFAPVQHTLRGRSCAYWQQHGGLPVFGYPLSEEFMEQSRPTARPTGCNTSSATASSITRSSCRHAQ